MVSTVTTRARKILLLLCSRPWLKQHGLALHPELWWWARVLHLSLSGMEIGPKSQKNASKKISTNFPLPCCLQNSGHIYFTTYMKQWNWGPGTKKLTKRSYQFSSPLQNSVASNCATAIHIHKFLAHVVATKIDPVSDDSIGSLYYSLITVVWQTYLIPQHLTTFTIYPCRGRRIEGASTAIKQNHYFCRRSFPL